MKISSFAPFIILFIVTFLIINMLTPYGAATTPDSLSYLDIAANIKNGHGARATDFSLENFQQVTFVENRLWPPLYPALLSLVIQRNFDVITVTYLSTALLFITVSLVYLILVSHIHWIIALSSSLLLCITSPLITVYTYVWSETLFIPLLLLSIWLSLQYLQCDNNRLVRRAVLLFMLSSTLILIVYTRYIGIVFFTLLPLIYFMRKPQKDHLLFLPVTLFYFGNVGYLLAENYLISHSITGGQRIASDKTLLENVVDTVAVLQTLLPHSLLIIAMLLMVALGTLPLKRIIINQLREDSTHAYQNKKNLIFILLPIGSVYVISMLAFRTYSQFDQLDVRLFAPAFPIFWMLCVVMLTVDTVHKLLHQMIHIAVIFLILTFSITGYYQLIQSIGYWKRYATPHHPLSINLFYANYTLPPTRTKKLKKIISGLNEENKESVIISKRPLIFKFMLGMKTLQQPEIINIEFLHKVNALPKGSLMLYQKEEGNPFTALLTDYEITYEYFEIGNIVATKLPVDISPIQK